MFPQHDQLYTWATVNQPPHSLDPLEGKLLSQIKDLWSVPRPGGDNRTGVKPTEAGKTNLFNSYCTIYYIWAKVFAWYIRSVKVIK